MSPNTKQWNRTTEPNQQNQTAMIAPLLGQAGLTPEAALPPKPSTPTPQNPKRKRKNTGSRRKRKNTDSRRRTVVKSRHKKQPPWLRSWMTRVQIDAAKRAARRDWRAHNFSSPAWASTPRATRDQRAGCPESACTGSHILQINQGVPWRNARKLADSAGWVGAHVARALAYVHVHVGFSRPTFWMRSVGRTNNTRKKKHAPSSI